MDSLTMLLEKDSSGHSRMKFNSASLVDGDTDQHENSAPLVPKKVTRIYLLLLLHDGYYLMQTTDSFCTCTC